MPTDRLFGRDVELRSIPTSQNEKKIAISEDFPREIDERRNKLYPFMRAAKNLNKNAYLKIDKLVIDNKTFSVETICDIPKEYHPSQSKEDEDHIYFAGKESPFSKFYQEKFSVDGQEYNCVEQYLQVQKARLFDDKQSEVAILGEENLAVQCEIGRNIKNFDKTQFRERSKEYAEKAMLEKFRQNVALKNALMDTGNKQIVEANAFETFWGAGLSLHNPDIHYESKWKGKNVMGTILTRVREKIKADKNP